MRAVDQIACHEENRIALETDSRDRVVITEDALTVFLVRTNNGTTEVNSTRITAGRDHSWAIADVSRIDDHGTVHGTVRGTVRGSAEVM